MNYLRQPWMIWYAISLHLLYGSLLLIDERQNVLALLGGFQHLLEVFDTIATGVLLVTVATIAALGLIFERRISRRWMLICLMPQYGVLVLALFSTVEVMFTGFTNSAGESVPFATILFALGPIALTAFWHSLAIISMLMDRVPPAVESELLRHRLTVLEVEKLQRDKQNG